MAEIVVKVPLYQIREAQAGGTMAARLEREGINVKEPITAAVNTEACAKCGSALIVFTGTLREDYGGVEVAPGPIQGEGERR